jgi:transposase
MGSARHPYPATFRSEAVDLVRSSGRSIRSIASDLGVDASTLRRWVQAAEIEDGHATGQRRTSDLTPDERSELTRLRREVRVLEQEREILKKAAAFFARETW